MNHYTYLLSTNNSNNQTIYYIGVRSSKCAPADDITYMGSSKLVDFMRTLDIKFTKEILATYETREQAELGEQEFFNTLECIERAEFINLHSHKNPYEVGRATTKMSYFKQLFPQLKPGHFVDSFNKITQADFKFCVFKGNLYWYFINHPDNLKHYWHTTGTKTYWPGRSDRLLSIKHSEPKYYLTDVETVSGTPFEQIQQLLDYHYVKGQRTHILETIEEQMKLLGNNERESAIELIKPQILPDNRYIFNRIVKYNTKVNKQLTKPNC